MEILLETNNPRLRSWLKVADNSDFPIQNLPFGIFEAGEARGACVAIGEYIVALHPLQGRGYFRELDLMPGIFSRPALNDFFGLGRKKIRLVRHEISRLLRQDNDQLKSETADGERFLFHQKEVRMLMPVSVKNYTDFYSSEEHAFNVGSMFRDPKNALLPNWKYLPVGYHGRASSIVVSGTDIRRPNGQIKAPDKSGPEFSPTRKLDFEVELAFVTCKETALGQPITVAESEEAIAGFVLFNDWSARDIQQWEYVPLGPFLGKNFASTISPWVVTLDALEPFRAEGPPQDPKVLPYLEFNGAKNFDIILETCLRPQGSESVILCRSNSKYLYWNACQQLAHHTVNGCNIQVGDLYASGTISGPSPGSFGSLLELSWNGEKPLTMPDGSVRTFLEDGDTVIMKGYAQKDGVRIGFGSCEGKVLPARKLDF